MIDNKLTKSQLQKYCFSITISTIIDNHDKHVLLCVQHSIHFFIGAGNTHWGISQYWNEIYV